MVSLGMVHIDLEQTHGSILLPRSHQQCFHISLSRMRYGEGMVVVKEVMEAMIWFHGPTNFSLSHLCTASSLLVFASFLGPPRQIQPGNSPHLAQQKPYGGGRSLLQPYTVKRDLSEGYVKDSVRGNELR
ncbi:hypothetical protein Bca52824_066297 [Brassica carinata]|uniref:Uncharacterized protein n=1 Tax=Brassica carinata TaxID=52824 RepID=A0A8X7UAF7_BRACI|nr:hypothetical protein Bca52824_066297 [Brassica carinata]